ncbi:DmpA family aminopeptidase [Gellertiella hungarica]|uniref:L-aminopeptidase/D-esterase-like protein n=1 Tax=Gellertiella hungarica TaxID=1572859 RepID=A0A7W6J1N3_9HYPH|nr:P1 family peptidase [Gellertiella hungarica]MBB4063087.1 L-aminopeptidase/D-esterase-like protein [Gellertiella hungarica]
MMHEGTVPDHWLKAPDGMPRARAFGLPLRGQPGPLNAITDVDGVEVGMTTLNEDRDGKAIRTGVTAILPRGKAGTGASCAAAVHSFNGNGEMTGFSWIEESGSFSQPIAITNSHSIGAAHEGLIRWMVANRPDVARQWMLPVAAETYDGFMSDINGVHVRPEHVIAALDGASAGPVAEGSYGGGTGMVCYGFKGGNGTASRQVELGGKTYTVGVFLQTNFGSREELTVTGTWLGDILKDNNPLEDLVRSGEALEGAGSCIGIVATDAPLMPTQLKAMARRVPLGLARTGTTGSHFSGDIFLAFSTANAGVLDSRIPDADPAAGTPRAFDILPWPAMNGLYEATVLATEEAVLNALIANRPMVGKGGLAMPAFPHAALAEHVTRR